MKYSDIYEPVVMQIEEDVIEIETGTETEMETKMKIKQLLFKYF